ncbi:dihydrolipoyl dehydrogenase [Mycolicibacterium sp. HS_4_1]
MTESNTQPVTHFDVVVLGAGPGGYVAAIRAAQLGLSVAVIEEKYWGGVCLNVGCIPSKVLLRNAEIVRIVCHEAQTYGLSGEIKASYRVAHERSRKVADGRAAGIHYLMKKNRIVEIDGRGSFTGPKTIEVRTHGGQLSTITFDHAVIATGARPKQLAGVELSDRVVTYEQLIIDPDPPESIVIVGAGAIGMEVGYVLNAYGTDVTIIEYADRVTPAEDVEVSRELAKAYRKLGIEVLTSARVESVHEEDGSARVAWQRGAGEVSTKTADKVLVAVGFEANSAGLGLDTAGVSVDARGAIVIDERMRTTTPHIYAVGDVTMKLQLAHVAEAMGVVAAETIGKAATMELGDYRMMPRAIFCQPQVASFGLTEEEARSEHAEVRVAKFPFSANGKAHSFGDAGGFVKLIADRDGALLGGHIVGADAAELLPELTLAQKWDLGSFEISRNVHVHPTLGEAIVEAVHGLQGHAINI